MDMTSGTVINLLPWREHKSKIYRKRFALTLTFFAAAGAALGQTVAWKLEDVVLQHNVAIERLENEKKTLDKKIADIRDLKKKRDELLRRVRIIERIQKTRYAKVDGLRAIAGETPSGVIIVSIENADMKWTITGYAESNGAVSDFMDSLARHKLFENPDLVLIEKPQVAGKGDQAFPGYQFFKITVSEVLDAEEKGRT